ncbi:TPA: peptidase T [Streptococcus equi subsp. zooepidemicus]|uniref:Peptidase T n=6 Tax=Streptococcus equi TaxID=1336 RepID=PEPT_STRE4|nr:peptidase T [Streptococcus equi]C0M8H1.1 RecName: Full=Peptidase T; AltName: Full=Aminotripeptidase; Short=Tripeptidase; AltName: Full=Tripeptide aminopeptidase [Streptococcus equi subsp. equi 4047]C0MGM6.1 RecName: Full=Peptidase T; AltName: Full=Aminotripeptidase; Short=Tripeptidase; AltName: Full=Tripeptide aminopeptidase [Streptococcus equi subsp. zooepidemicus H70]KIS13287.1 peptidase T [Streptococcus equi subsp. zooepidemicus Sz105]KIS17892.1 peptidase T [Streptococcus equi subsp. zooe
MTYETLLERFLNYVKINTRSNPASTTTPSTKSQADFALTVLKPEMEAIGLQDIHYNPANGYLIGSLPANSSKLTRKIGFIAHMDTADFNAEGVAPQIIESYQGGEIKLGQSGYSLCPEDFPNLNQYLGQTLITTDGTTLLGADDKSGIAEIMTAIEFLVANPQIEHCDIKVAFGPDEEIGVGADKFDVNAFDVDFAYTIDGGPLGELQYETFSAAALELKVLGRNVHPGTAKNQMINALQLAMDFHSQLPVDDRPEKTDGYQGFYHLHSMSGTVEEAQASYIIRDFEDSSFEARKAFVTQLAEEMNSQLGAERVFVTVTDQYYNMKKVIEKDMTPVNLAKAVMEDLAIKPVIEPIRGGTDGSKISFMGIPTPNIFAGGENMHGRFEFVSLQTMEKAVDVILGIVQKA